MVSLLTYLRPTPEPKPASRVSRESTEPLVSPSKRRNLTPRKPLASLRQAFASSKQHRKRGSIYSIAEKSGHDISDDGPLDPASLSESREDNDTTGHHKRRVSLAGSFVGSIRGLGKLGSQKKHSLATEQTCKEPSPAETPLPSSPINIPAQRTPSLSLDFGEAAFKPLEFERPSQEAAPAMTQLATSVGIPTGRPIEQCSFPPELQDKTVFDHRPRPVTPKDFLCPPIDTHEHLVGTPPTPMPGTTFTLQVDGADSDKAMDMPVSERSVESASSPSKKSDKVLRSMRSMDAMAEACTIAHKSDDAAESADATVETVSTAHYGGDDACPTPTLIKTSPIPSGAAITSIDLSQQGGSTPESTPDREDGQVARPPWHRLKENVPKSPAQVRRDLASATSTISSCPVDMPELERTSRHSVRMVPESPSPLVGPRDSTTSDLINGYPFVGDESAPEESESVSPNRQATLPFRPKTSMKFDVQRCLEHFDQSPSPGESPVEQSNQSTPVRSGNGKSAQPRCSYEPIFFKPYLDKAAAKELGIPRPGSCPSLRKKYSADARKAGKAFLKTVDALVQDTWYNSSAVQDRREPSETPRKHDSDVQVDKHDSELHPEMDYDEFKTRETFAEGGVGALPSTEGTETSTPTASVAGSPHGGPLMTRLYHFASQKGSPSPKGTSTTRTSTDVNDVFWRFSVPRWLGDAIETGTGTDVPATPHPRRRPSRDSSIDAVSILDEPNVPATSPMSADLEGTPTMGNRMEFEDRRAERNMRYEALQDGSPGRRTASPSLHPSALFTFKPAPEDDEEELQFADFESAYAGSREATPQTKKEPAQQSEDSTVDSLRTSAAAYHKLHEKLEDLDDIDIRNQRVQEYVQRQPINPDDYEEPFRTQIWDRMRCTAEAAFKAADDTNETSGYDEPESPDTSVISLTPSMQHSLPSSSSPTKPIPISSANAGHHVVSSPESGYKPDSSPVTPESRKRYGKHGRRKTFAPVDFTVVGQALC